MNKLELRTSIEAELEKHRKSMAFAAPEMQEFHRRNLVDALISVVDTYVDELNTRVEEGEL